MRRRQPRGLLGTERGAGFMSVLVALLIAAALYFGYFQFQNTEANRTGPITALDATREFACHTNRQTIEREITMWLVSHAGDVPSLAQLEEEQGTLPTCPEGGTYSLSGRKVLCSVHP